MATDRLRATLFLNSNMINVVDGNGVTQTFYYSAGKAGYTWRDHDGQYGVRKTEGDWGEFIDKLIETAR